MANELALQGWPETRDLTCNTIDIETNKLNEKIFEKRNGAGEITGWLLLLKK